MNYAHAHKHMMAIIKHSPLLTLSLYVCGEAFQQYFMLINRLTVQNTGSPSILAACGQSLVSITEFVFLTMLIPQRIMELDLNQPPQSFLKFAQTHIAPLTAEGLRAFAKTILWALILIIPGLYKSIRLFFVPYVVVADPEYMAGRRDALEYSETLTKGCFWRLLFTFIAMTALEFAGAGVAERYPIQASPLISIASSLLLFLISFYVNVLLFRFYQERVIRCAAPQKSGV